MLEGEDLSEEITSWIDEVVERLVELHTEGEFAEEWDLDALVAGDERRSTDADVTADELREDLADMSREALIEEFLDDARELYEEKEESSGRARALREIERYIVLQVVDTRWREHLENMDYLREGVHLRAMAQKDPLVEYRSEGHAMFEELGAPIREEVLMLALPRADRAAEAEELDALGRRSTAAGSPTSTSRSPARTRSPRRAVVTADA